MLVALDTNILIYSAGFNDRYRAQRARDISAALGPHRIMIATQVLGEFYNAMVGKLKQDRALALHACRLWTGATIVRSADEAVFEEALEIAARHQLQFWDALILSTAAAAECRALLSEDMQHGFVHRGVAVINPFAEPMHPLLADATGRS